MQGTVNLELLELLNKNRFNDVMRIILPDKLTKEELELVDLNNSKIKDIISNLDDKDKLNLITKILGDSFYNDHVYYRNAYHDVMKILLMNTSSGAQAPSSCDWSPISGDQTPVDEYDSFCLKKYKDGLLC